MAKYFIYNGPIHTMSRHGTVEAMYVEDGEVKFIGNSDHLVRQLPSKTKKIDLQGRSVLPGFHDSHIHLLGYALGLNRINLFGIPTKEEGLSIIAETLKEQTSGKWIVGAGWDKSLWGEFPTRQDLDSVTEGSPVCLSSKDVHSIWVNSKALEICGIDKHTGTPDGGAILKDSSGEPLGILQDTAQDLVLRNIPDTTDEEAYNAISKAIPRLWSMGITCVHAPEGLKVFRIAQRIRRESNLPFRIAFMPPAASLDALHAFDIQQGYGDNWVWTAQIKTFKDGSLGSSTALLYEPYEHLPDFCGLECITDDELHKLVARSVEAGYGVAIHAIGDKAVSRSLDAVEANIEQSRQKQVRHRIEHAQMVHPNDIKRFSQLGVIASIQPGHVVADRYMVEKEWGERSVTAYPFGQLLQAKTRFALGSDAPVEVPDVIYGMHCAANRCLPGESDEFQWHPMENLPIETVLRGYTKDAAYAVGKEDVLGALAPGMCADFVIVSQDLMSIPTNQIGYTEVEAVCVNGQWVIKPTW